MAFTPQGTMIGRFSGASYLTAFTNPQGLDLVQVVNEGGDIVFNIEDDGTCNVNPISPTTRDNGSPIAVLAQYFGASLAAAFSNPSRLDLIQIIAPHDGSILAYVDYLGTAH